MQRRLGKLFRKAPQFTAAGNRRMVVQKHAVGVAALPALKRNRDHLPALGVVAEAGRIRHADELELHQRLADLQRLRNEFAKLLWIGPVSDNQELAIDEAVRSNRIGRTGEWHRERALLH